MTYKIKCDGCKELIYSDARKCKDCGWINKTISESIPEQMIRCSHFDCQKIGKYLNRANEKEYFCDFHLEEWILKNQNDPYRQIQAQRILLTRQFIQEAKDFGISNCEYFKKNCSGWNGVKDALISQKEKNNNSSNTVNLEDIEF